MRQRLVAYVEVPAQPTQSYRSVGDETTEDSDFNGDELFCVGRNEDDHDSGAVGDGDEDEALTFRPPFARTCSLSCLYAVQPLLNPMALGATIPRQSERSEYVLAACTGRRRTARLTLI